MGFWNKLGKTLLTAAPYIAAPFTGGASLMATGLANKAVSKWAESDAKKAIAKGLAPSSFDRVLGKIGNIASTASMFIPGGQLGSLGKAGSTVAKTAGNVSKLGKVANIASKASKIGDAVGAGMSVINDIQGMKSPVPVNAAPAMQSQYQPAQGLAPSFNFAQAMAGQPQSQPQGLLGSQNQLGPMMNPQIPSYQPQPYKVRKPFQY